MPTLSLAMNIGALFGLTTSTPGSAPKLGAPGFEALLAGLLSGLGSPPVESVFEGSSGGPPGEWPPPPPPPLAGLGVEELKTSEPNAPSKKPDLPALTQAQPSPNLGFVPMAMPNLAVVHPQLEALLQAPSAGLRIDQLSDQHLALETEGQTQPAGASTDPLQAALNKLLDSPELNVKMVRVDVPVVEGPLACTAESATLGLTALNPTAPATHVAETALPDQPMSSAVATETQGPAFQATWPEPDVPRASSLAPEGAIQHEQSRSQTLQVATLGVNPPQKLEAENALTEHIGQPPGNQPLQTPLEPAAAGSKPTLIALESAAPRPPVSQTSEPATVDKPVSEQPEDALATTSSIANREQNTPMSESGADKDNLDEESKGDNDSPKSEFQRPQPEIATGRRADEAPGRPEPAETAGGVRAASRAQLAHADRIEAFAATRPRGTITIDMDPLDLGKIQLVVKQSEGMIEAHVVAQDERVRQALQASQAHLLQSFENRGVRLEQFQISAPSSSTTAEFGREHRQPPQPAQQTPPQGRLNPQASSRPVLAASACGGVDLTI